MASNHRALFKVAHNLCVQNGKRGNNTQLAIVRIYVQLILYGVGRGGCGLDKIQWVDPCDWTGDLRCELS